MRPLIFGRVALLEIVRTIQRDLLNKAGNVMRRQGGLLRCLCEWDLLCDPYRADWRVADGGGRGDEEASFWEGV